jgi:hypothetical protein
MSGEDTPTLSVHLGDTVSYAGHAHIGWNTYAVVGVNGDNTGIVSYDIQLDNGLEAALEPDARTVHGVTADQLTLLLRRAN